MSGLALGDASVRIRAADALSIPLGKTPRLLMSDLDAIAATLDLTPQPELQALEQFVRVKDAKMIEQLEEELRAALAGGSNGRLALGRPHERIDDNGTPISWPASRSLRSWASAVWAMIRSSSPNARTER